MLQPRHVQGPIIADENQLTQTTSFGRETSAVLRGSVQQDMLKACKETEVLNRQVQDLFKGGQVGSRQRTNCRDLIHVVNAL